jgi:DNA-binding MarR family transcriptional regulator
MRVDEGLGYLLAKAAQRWNELLGRAFREAGFSDVRPAYGSLLVPLFDEEGMQMVELARRAGLSKQTLTTQLRTLEERDLVIRRSDPEDGRAYRVYLGGRGREFKTAALPILSALEQEIAAALPRRSLATLKKQLAALMTYDKEGGGLATATG